MRQMRQEARETLLPCDVQSVVEEEGHEGSETRLHMAVFESCLLLTPDGLQLSTLSRGRLRCINLTTRRRDSRSVPLNDAWFWT